MGVYIFMNCDIVLKNASLFQSNSMDMDNIPASSLNCFICEGPETPVQKLAQATPKGYPTLLAYPEAVGNATMLERMKEAWNDARLRYHVECKRDLYNKSVKATLKSSHKCDMFY